MLLSAFASTLKRWRPLHTTLDLPDLTTLGRQAVVVCDDDWALYQSATRPASWDFLIRTGIDVYVKTECPVTCKDQFKIAQRHFKSRH